jgi:hypothetical protein
MGLSMLSLHSYGRHSHAEVTVQAGARTLGATAFSNGSWSGVQILAVVLSAGCGRRLPTALEEAAWANEEFGDDVGVQGSDSAPDAPVKFYRLR